MAERWSRNRGFTLIELLTAVAIMALLAVLSWRAIDGMGRTQTVTQSRSEALQRLQAGLLQWTLDLDAITDTREVNAIDFNGQALRLTRRDMAASLVDNPGLRVVAWARRNGPDGSQWMRWQSGPIRQRDELARAWQRAADWARGVADPAPANAAGDSAVALLPVSDWQLLFHRGETWVNPQSSVGALRPGDELGGNARLPNGVRLMLSLPEGGPITGQITRDWVRPTLEAGQ